jgi:hypothetical protein
MMSTGGRAHQQGIPKWALDLMARGREQGYVWDADIVEQQPRMINTPILDEWIARFEAERIEVRESVIRIPEEVRRTWIRERRRALEVHVTTWTPKMLVDADRASLADLPVAEHRIDDGEFGRCVWCGGWQYKDSLAMFPEKLYCSEDCEVRARERGQKVDAQDRAIVRINPPSETTWSEIRRLSGTEPGTWPMVFSCNISRRCWPATPGHFTHESQRRYLEGKSTFLDSVTRLVLQHRFYGGQFAVYRQRIAWASSGATIHQF